FARLVCRRDRAERRHAELARHFDVLRREPIVAAARRVIVVERSKRTCRYLKTRSTASAAMKASRLGVVVSPVLLVYRAHVFALTPTRPRTRNRVNERRRCRIFDSRETRHQATNELKVTLEIGR